VGEEAGQDPLSHPPDHAFLQLIGLDLAAFSGYLEPHGVVGVRSKQVVDGYPVSRGHLVIGGDLRLRPKDEHVGTNRYWRERGRTGDNIFEATRQVAFLERDAELLTGLPNGGGNQVGIGRLAAAARQRDVTRPGISSPFGPANEKNGVGIGGENDRHGSPDQRGIVGLARRVILKTLTEAGKPGG
jgi:hypothetical protein